MAVRRVARPVHPTAAAACAFETSTLLGLTQRRQACSSDRVLTCSKRRLRNEWHILWLQCCAYKRERTAKGRRWRGNRRPAHRQPARVCRPAGRGALCCIRLRNRELALRPLEKACRTLCCIEQQPVQFQFQRVSGTCVLETKDTAAGAGEVAPPARIPAAQPAHAQEVGGALLQAGNEPALAGEPAAHFCLPSALTKRYSVCHVVSSWPPSSRPHVRQPWQPCVKLHQTAVPMMSDFTFSPFDQPSLDPLKSHNCVQAMAQRRRPAGQKAFDVLHGTAAAADARRDERRQAATAAEMQVGLCRTISAWGLKRQPPVSFQPLLLWRCWMLHLHRLFCRPRCGVLLFRRVIQHATASGLPCGADVRSAVCRSARSSRRSRRRGAAAGRQGSRDLRQPRRPRRSRRQAAIILQTPRRRRQSPAMPRRPRSSPGAGRRPAPLQGSGRQPARGPALPP